MTSAVVVSSFSHTVSGSPQDTINLSWTNPAWPVDTCGSSTKSRLFRIEFRRNGGAWQQSYFNTIYSAASQPTSWTISGLTWGEYDVRIYIRDTYNELQSDLSTCLLVTSPIAWVNIYAIGVNYTDTTPDAFDLGTGGTLLPLSSYDYSDWITVKGITGGTSISVSNLAWRRNDGAWQTSSGTVYPQDRVQVRLATAATYSTQTSGTLTIGGVSDTFACTTRPDIGDVLITNPWTTAPISLFANIKDFFGPYGGLPSLSNYVRGGSYVPDIPANSSVPNAVPIKETDLCGASIEFYATKELETKTAVHQYDSSLGETSAGGSGSKLVEWAYPTDYDFAPGARGQAEFQITGWGVDSQESSLDINVSLTTLSNAQAPNWTRDNPLIRLLFDHNTDYSNGMAQGWIEMKVRSVYDNTKIITMYGRWIFLSIDLNGLNS